MIGIITDIHRTSVVDGPGLRTTVFLKGCPLRCSWCHNPETQRPGVELAHDPDKCTGCGGCADVCPEAAFSLANGRARWDRTRCASHGACEAACPSGSLFYYGRTWTADEVAAEVLKDLAYYAASGGGVTVSGGEPLAQPEFAIGILQRCRNSGVATALDTSGFTSRRNIDRTLECTDLYLFDYKATGEQLHLRLTGVSLQPILENLDFLVSCGARIILRCPVIPGINDQPAHLAAIADMEFRYPSLEGIEILTWHRMGISKYERLGRKADPELPLTNVPDLTKSRYRKIFAGRGCSKVRVC